MTGDTATKAELALAFGAERRLRQGMLAKLVGYVVRGGECNAGSTSDRQPRFHNEVVRAQGLQFATGFLLDEELVITILYTIVRPAQP